MKYRKLRIAWSIFWGVACVLLMVLWVRSFRTYDVLRRNFVGVPLEIISVQGRLKITRTGPNWVVTSLPSTASYSIERPQAEVLERHVRGFANWWGFGVERGNNLAVLVPYWFVVSASGIFMTLSWVLRLRRQFSLRTLLIATTLVAVVMGLIVYAVRR